MHNRVKLLMCAALLFAQPAAADALRYSDTLRDQPWGRVAFEYWKNSLASGVGGIVTAAPVAGGKQVIPSLLLGYDDYFFSYAARPPSNYQDPAYPNGMVRHQSGGLTFGYYLEPEIALVLGLRDESDKFGELYFGTTHFRTLGIAVSLPMPRTPYFMLGNITFGSGDKTDNNGIKATYASAEAGMGYNLDENWVFTLVYRAEKYHTAVPLGPTADMGWVYSDDRATVAGLAATFAYRFH